MPALEVWRDPLKEVLLHEYSLEMLGCSNLPSFADINFYIQTTNHNDGNEFVVKVYSEGDSQQLSVIVHHVKEAGVVTGTAILTSSNRSFTVIKSPKDMPLVLTIGRFAGKIDKIMKNFPYNKNNAFENGFTFKNYGKMKGSLHLLPEDVQKDSTAFITTLEAKLKAMTDFSQGMTHGDFHAANIICLEPPNDDVNNYGIIDYGDAQYTYHVVELAVCLAHMLILHKDMISNVFEIRDTLFKGYCEYITLHQEEKSFVLPLTCARVLLVNICALKETKSNPENSYAGSFINLNLLTKLLNICKCTSKETFQ